MRITLHPENTQEEFDIRKRAKSAHNLGESLARYLDRDTVTAAATEWVKEHPTKPGPGSVVQHNREGNIRMVGNDGGLITTDGKHGRTPNRWAVGTGEDEYTVLFDIEGAS